MKFHLKPLRAAFTAVLLALLCTSNAPAREGTEWSTVYWYNANDEKLPRVLLIGDSIVKGYEAAVRNELAGTAYVSFYATSKSVSDPFYLKELAPILEAYNYKVIQFNNGLHSLGEDPRAWEAGLRTAVGFLKQNGKGAKLLWASSTPLNDPAQSAKVEVLNQTAAAVMTENGIPCDDLFALMNPQSRSAYWVDKYHFNTAGVAMEAKQVAETIRNLLGAGKASSEAAAAALRSAASETGPDGKIDPSRQPEPQPLMNPAFEQGTKGWAIYPNDGRKGTIEITREGPPSGKPAALLNVTEAGLQFYQSKPSFKPGTAYRLSFWAQSQAPVSLLAFVRTFAPPYQFFGDRSVLTIQPEWKKYELKFAFPADYNPAACNFFFDFKSAGTCWIADITTQVDGGH